MSSQTSLIAIDQTKSRPDGQGVASVDMPVNLPDGWVYDKVFGPQGQAQHAMKAGGQPRYDRSGGGFLTPDAERSTAFAFDGGATRRKKPPPRQWTRHRHCPTKRTCPRPSSRPSPTRDRADQSYPVLPLTVVPKPEASPLASLKAPDMNRQIAMLALVLALLSGLTFILWRYHRRDYASPRRIGRRI